MKRLFSILISLLAVSVAFSGLVDLAMAHPVATAVAAAGGVLAVKYAYHSQPFTGFHRYAVQVEAWQDFIAGNLFKENPFLQFCKRADQYVLMGKVVHIPQAGGKPNVVKNRTALPASVTQRTDTDVTYALDSYTTDPITIRDAETYELSYDKMDSILGEHQEALNETFGDNILITWAPTATGNILRTTGDPVTTHIVGTTGTRKALKAVDLSKAQTLLNKQKVSKADRYALMSEDMHDQLKADLSITSARDYSVVIDPVTGRITKLHGFTILTRPDVVVYNAAATAVNAYGAAVAGTDNDGVLCWQKNAVEVALGETKFFEQKDAPDYYGDVYSAEVKAGGRRVRNDSAGIVAIVQV